MFLFVIAIPLCLRFSCGYGHPLVLLLSSNKLEVQSKHNFIVKLIFNEPRILILYKLDDDDECIWSKQVASKQFDLLLTLFLEWSCVAMNKIFTRFFKDYSMKRIGGWSYICRLSSVFSTTFSWWLTSHPFQFTPSTRWVGHWGRP